MSFFATLHREIIDAAGRCGLTAREAADMAQSVEESLRRDYAGQRPYVPAVTRAERNRQIRAAFDGRNGEAVCRQFGISKSTLRRIVGDGSGKR